MMEGWLILVGGLLGSSHCIGMCGGFALTIGAGARHWTDNLRRQLIYSLGRIFTYASIGAVTGYAGLRLAQFVPKLVNVQATLAILAGCLLALQGLKSLGWVRWPRIGKSTTGCLGSQFFAPFSLGAELEPGVSGRHADGLAPLRAGLCLFGAGSEHRLDAAWAGLHGPVWRRDDARHGARRLRKFAGQPDDAPPGVPSGGLVRVADRIVVDLPRRRFVAQRRFGSRLPLLPAGRSRHAPARSRFDIRRVEVNFAGCAGMHPFSAEPHSEGERAQCVRS